MRFLSMRKIPLFTVLGALAVVMGGAAVTLWHADISSAVDWRDRPEIYIVLTEDGFHPREARITKGTTVTFSTTRDGQFWPASNSHPAHELYPEFDPMRPLEPGETWSFTVNDSGTWGIHDHIRAYYRGTLFVE